VSGGSLGSSVSTETDYWLDGRGIGVRLQAEASDLSVPHSVQTDPEGHPTSYSMGGGGTFPGSKAAGAQS
jgi:hypothetical protein